MTKPSSGYAPRVVSEMNTMQSATPISEAKLKANRANAKLATGPKDPARSRLNALKHGLSARVAWPGQDVLRDQEFFLRAWACISPRNPMEKVYATNLLQTRLRENVFLEVEATVLTRPPVSSAPGNDLPFKFLDDPGALKTLEQLARHLSHLTQAAEKSLLGLLRVRQENWGQNESPSRGTEDLRTVGQSAREASVAGSQPEVAVPQAQPGTLEACLADPRLILPGEDRQTYESMARELWTTFGPTNILEGFVATDFIQAQWRLDRVLRIQRVLMERSAVSASGHDCGFGFAFIQDSQRGQALESLRQYEAVLRRRLEKRMSLWGKLRKQGWTHSVSPCGPAPTEPAPAGVTLSSNGTADDPLNQALDQLEREKNPQTGVIPARECSVPRSNTGPVIGLTMDQARRCGYVR